jgi:hypothetical protein
MALLNPYQKSGKLTFFRLSLRGRRRLPATSLLISLA